MNYTTETIKEVHTMGNTNTVKVIITWRQTSSVSVPVGVEVVSLDDQPVTVKVMQSLNLGSVMKEARRRNFSASRVTDEEISEKVKKTQGKETSIEHLEVVAKVYVEAYQLGEPVQKYVAERLGFGVSTVAKMIMKARQQGLIPQEANKRSDTRVATRVAHTQ
jgi:hypothetical protein